MTGQITYVKKDNVAIGVSIVQINAVKTLWELYVTCFLPISRVHHETHGFFQSFAVVEVVITIDIQKICSIGKHGRNSDLQIK